LFENGVPICLNCSAEQEAKRKRPPAEPQITRILSEELAEATELAVQASERFFAIMTEIPSGFPHPDGVQRIHNASHELSLARKEITKAHDRLNDFLSRGIVPSDLKRSE
jgi:hypothetical protein